MTWPSESVHQSLICFNVFQFHALHFFIPIYLISFLFQLLTMFLKPKPLSLTFDNRCIFYPLDIWLSRITQFSITKINLRNQLLNDDGSWHPNIKWWWWRRRLKRRSRGGLGLWLQYRICFWSNSNRYMILTA